MITLPYDRFFWCAAKRLSHDGVIKWKDFPRDMPLVRRIHRSPVNCSHKSQWRRGLMFSLICAWIHGWVNNREASDLRRHCAHYDVIVMLVISHASAYNGGGGQQCPMPQSNHTPGPRMGCSRAVHRLFLTKIVRPLTGPAPCGAIRILPSHTGPVES